mmetsp:Transcript_101616/g.152276  ORF Transcript_101616/g.152276 Transcript_101616/m.152276 type:complete len:210 (+) Transcript_101616:1067-1696(+)
MPWPCRLTTARRPHHETDRTCPPKRAERWHIRRLVLQTTLPPKSLPHRMARPDTRIPQPWIGGPWASSCLNVWSDTLPFTRRIPSRHAARFCAGVNASKCRPRPNPNSRRNASISSLASWPVRNLVSDRPRMVRNSKTDSSRSYSTNGLPVLIGKTCQNGKVPSFRPVRKSFPNCWTTSRPVPKRMLVFLSWFSVSPRTLIPLKIMDRT